MLLALNMTKFTRQPSISDGCITGLICVADIYKQILDTCCTLMTNDHCTGWKQNTQL